MQGSSLQTQISWCPVAVKVRLLNTSRLLTAAGPTRRESCMVRFATFVVTTAASLEISAMLFAQSSLASVPKLLRWPHSDRSTLESEVQLCRTHSLPWLLGQSILYSLLYRAQRPASVDLICKRVRKDVLRLLWVFLKWVIEYITAPNIDMGVPKWDPNFNFGNYPSVSFGMRRKVSGSSYRENPATISENLALAREPT